MVVGRILLAPAWPRGVRILPLAGRFKFMRVRCVLLAATRVDARYARDLSMESCLVALSIARGGWSVWQRAPVWSHYGPPSGGNRVFECVWLGGFLAK